VSSPYEAPEDPEVHIDTTGLPPEELVKKVRHAISDVLQSDSPEG
jgi:adenylylsulfate kinase-like enzyme